MRAFPFWLISFCAVNACDTLNDLPNFCACRGHALICETPQVNFTSSISLPMFMGWGAFHNDVWQQASTMTVAGFRFPTGIASESTIPSNNLRELTIADGEGRSVGDKAFQYCGSMNKLALTSMKLDDIHENSFLGLGSLRILDLSHNNLTFVPDDAFQWLGSINEINLSFNKFYNSTKMGMMVSQFAQLVKMTLAVNNLADVPDVSACNYLESVDLSYNAFEKLQGIDTAGNYISPLRGLDRLIELDLSNNKIQWVDGNFFRDLRVLTTLKLGHNRIQSFQGYFFLRTVEFLDLSHNALTSVGNEAMIGDNMQNLKQLRLNENQLVLCDAFFYQISRLPYLQALDLKQANMPCVCDIPNFHGVMNTTSVVLENPAGCLLHDATSVCIGPTDATFSCNGRVSKPEVTAFCKKQIKKYRPDDICDAETGQPKATWHNPEPSSSFSFTFSLILFFCTLLV